MGQDSLILCYPKTACFELRQNTFLERTVNHVFEQVPVVFTLPWRLHHPDADQVLTRVYPKIGASQAAPVRMTSVSPLQALSLWNNKFTLRYAEHLAELASHSAQDLPRQVDAVTWSLWPNADGIGAGRLD